MTRMHIHNRNSRGNHRKGQSIVEAMIALALLVTALIGIETLLARSFMLNRVTDDQTKATYLASEGIEITKSLIDNQTYAASGGGWNAFCTNQIPALVAGGNETYQVDWTTVACPAPISVGNASPLWYDASTGFYYQNPGSGRTETPFTRTVRITKSSDGNELDVQSTITWSTGTLTGQTLTLEDQFYNWRP